MTPFHLGRLERAEALFAELGVARVAYLLIPDYHGVAPADTDAFRAWCRRDRPFAVDWVLHGYYHLETGGGGPAQRGGRHPEGGGWSTALKRRYATAGEGEFLALDEPEATARIRRGILSFNNVIGRLPDAFVPPAWLYSEALPAVLRSAGLRFWEDHSAVYDAETGGAVRAPVITWATRTPLRKWTSLLGTPLLGAAWRRAPLLRLAVHPFDFDHPRTVKSIRGVWRRAMRGRDQVGYKEVFDALQ